MSAAINLGKLVTLIGWAVMIANALHPFAGMIGVVLLGLLMATAAMHLAQVAILHFSLGSRLSLSLADYGQVLVFGAFALLQYHRKLQQ
ncbi:DUF1145 domain-containing protein [Shewanella sp. NIFS-20-20]|uniref:DUF1145 domain-containing protein n=1 Tax=Shewanella sp. NIFS-20-20 TaxID=2853806 RepID=UPI001C48DBCD|nr:DUF1145 domain-containing protein [Shewanella sp. NIFS-20-20]MBV7316323.1 DUF1145 domain-containing protein [Shewanella sp. NIFS-20-20]